jgi:D-lactate dehydrogenase
MEKTKIAFFEAEDWEKEYIEPRLKGFDLFFTKEKLNQKNIKLAKDAEIVSPFIYSKIDKSAIDSFKKLKYITTRSAGFDHIDVKTCNRKGIKISNVPSYGENTVAEHTFALILALTRKIYPSIKKAKEGDFSLDGLRGTDLKGKTIGIVGVGHIGKHVIRIAKGFSMEVLAYDKKKDLNFSKQYNFKYTSLENLLKNSDIITLHVPYNKETRHLINLRTIKLFKKGSYLINTSRGEICDTTALLKGLSNGLLAGLGLDVMKEECFIKEEREILSLDFQKRCDLKTILENNILAKKPNVVITPHNAFNSEEALKRILDTTIENIKSFSNKKLINTIK